MDEMGIWGSGIATDHPWVIEDLAEGSAVGRVCDEHPGQEVFAICEKKIRDLGVGGADEAHRWSTRRDTRRGLS